MNFLLTIILAAAALSLLQIRFGNADSQGVCTPTGMLTPCSNNPNCTFCPSETFNFRLTCAPIGTTNRCKCGLAGFPCSSESFCCDGSHCTQSDTCPPAERYGACLIPSCNQCVDGLTCQPDDQAAAAFNGVSDYGTCQ